MKKKKYSFGKKYKDISETIEKRYNILIILVISLLSVLGIALFIIQIINQSTHSLKVEELSENIVFGATAPRGRIYDRFGNIIVDNQAIKVIYYKKESGITTKEEIKIAEKLSEMLEIDYSKVTDNNIRTFWVKQNSDEAKKRITDEEYRMLKERKITDADIEKYKLERVTKEEVESINPEVAYIYSLMNKGYSYSEKIIKQGDVTDLEYALIGENIEILKGVNTRLDWERYYPYGDVFRSILGTVSSTSTGVPYELKEYYLDKGYSLNDQVGTSYLEYQYDEYLKGTKNEYKVANNNYKLIKEGKRGNDLVLSIDINLQKEVEQILKEEVMTAKYEANTKYYNKSFVIITDPNTGEILAMAGKQVKEVDGKYKIFDYIPGIVTSPIVPGSIVKGASHIVGYNTEALKIGEIRDDSCIKIAATPKKCSLVYLGSLNDVSALALSSNTYQFRTAIKVGKGNYQYNKPLSVDTEAFDIYRNTFGQFGLGVKTGIDLPVESLGYKGTSRLSGYLLDFSIGQYDTYTPIQISQYISTIANGGNRVAPSLLKSVYSSDGEALTNKIYENKVKILNKVDTKPEYLNRVKEGFRAVMTFGTGTSYISSYYNAAGKTGTSESFIDTDGDGVVDTETISNAFIAYAPYDNPKVTFTVISPDISPANVPSYSRTAVNKRIVNRVTKKYFQLYK